MFKLSINTKEVNDSQKPVRRCPNSISCSGYKSSIPNRRVHFIKRNCPQEKFKSQMKILKEKNLNKHNSSFTRLQLINRIVELESQLEQLNRVKNFGCTICLERSKNAKITCNNTEFDVSHLSSSPDKNLEENEYVDVIFINFNTRSYIRFLTPSRIFGIIEIIIRFYRKNIIFGIKGPIFDNRIFIIIFIECSNKYECKKPTLLTGPTFGRPGH